MGRGSLPPGFRFHPTDEELVGYYLKRKLEGLEIELEVIPEVNLYKFDPWELPEKSFLPDSDMEWYFFCPRDRKYPNGSRTNRATKIGYWKATGKDRKVVCHSSVTGYRKTLVFYTGRAPAGDRTEWVMHEYRLSDDITEGEGSQNFQGPFALCRILKKNEQAMKKNNTDRCSKAKQFPCSSMKGDVKSTRTLDETVIISGDLRFQQSGMATQCNYSSTLTLPITPMVEGDILAAPQMADSSSLWVSPYFILDSSKEFSSGQEVVHIKSLQNEFPKPELPSQAYEQIDLSSSSSYSTFTGEIELTKNFLIENSMSSPYSGHGDYMDFFVDGNMSHEGMEVLDTAPICRQISGDGSFGDFSGLWTPEDNYVVVI
ncbi:NAC domain-containing protein 71 [Daucus carota subsp. sativus]|uniref:NAC domain-containing protein 71 n=1 Tax=Daucus carota subsp. sativus TaxID=79200 RepID=UPI0007EF4F21|nr:PREDICTED: NAC domain-containing protein 14-like [Daucus carota subsp. sativus]